jgi:hypothetical protein
MQGIRNDRLDTDMQRLLIHARRIAELQYNETRHRLTIVYRSGRARPLKDVDQSMVLKLVSQLARKNVAFVSSFAQLAICL